jgi:hypothetical protein
MLIAEERVKVHDFVDRFKMAVVSSDPGTWVHRMFPQWMQAEQSEQTVTEAVPAEEDEDLDLDDTEGTWIFTGEVTPEEAEAAFAEVLADRGGSISWSDLGADDEGWM